jgi:hypothetical protein
VEIGGVNASNSHITESVSVKGVTEDNILFAGSIAHIGVGLGEWRLSLKVV